MGYHRARLEAVDLDSWKGALVNYTSRRTPKSEKSGSKAEEEC
jgi:hypothetical protein